VLLVDSKRYTGSVSQTADGRVWHNHYPMDQQLGALRLEAEAIGAALGVPVRPVMCVHGARVAYGGLQAGVVEIVPAGRLRSMLRDRAQQPQAADVAALVAHALRCCTRPVEHQDHHRQGRRHHCRGRRRPGRVAWWPTAPVPGAGLVSELGPNAFGEPAGPGRVDCYLGLPLPAAEAEGDEGGVLVVAPRWLLHPAVPQPAGSLVYELVTGHPDRQPGALVFPGDLTVELRAWPAERWAALGVDLE